MQDLRSIRDESPTHFQDPLYLEEQDSHRLGELGGVTAMEGLSKAVLGAVVTPLSPGLSSRRYESETDDEELWSDSQVSPQPSPRRDHKPLSHSQSMRSLRNIPGKEVPWEGDVLWWGVDGAGGS
ncbi:hypothetical protein WISP_00238 [Willisornis vidua]|uniref:Uncharacterized protein n=1 Tax=Willisornis vidua TaxID=1566151 RepID=A0ABQ9CJS6_9PASS|nr:hypothetical protein WISP_00238 [Willisornis vidua]